MYTTAGTPQRLFSQSLTGGPNCVLFYQCRIEVDTHGHHGRIKARLRQRHTVGIVVDRVTAHGVRRVGRVPLGTHPRGALSLRWNLEVNGRPLPTGRYHVTLRALDRRGHVLGLTRPVTVRIRG